MPIPAETFFLPPDGEGSLQSQIQTMVAEAILSGRLRPGERMPSSRALAQHLGVSRITVTSSYAELLVDEYLTSRARSGYYVSDNAPQPPKFPVIETQDRVDWNRALGQRFAGEARLEKPVDWRQYRYPFIYGQADPSIFDQANWRLCALQALGQRDFDALTTDYADRDDPKLIEFIQRHTLPRRGIIAGDDEILVTMGAQNALWLAANVLLNQRRVAAIENPCYPSLREILTQSRCHMHAIDVDADGLPPDALPVDTDVVFTTPSHQCPTTATMPLDRRRALLERAARDDFLIVEDDYEFEMAFLQPPSPSLKSLDRDGRVIYVGSFSKSLFPGLRLGYLVGSAPFIREARALRTTVLRHPPGLLQRTAAYFLSLGHYDALIRRMGKALMKRRNIMDAALRRHGLTISGQGVYGGSSFWMQAPAGCDTEALAKRLQTQDVLIEPGRTFFSPEAAEANYFRLAYSSIPTGRIEEGVARIAEAIRQC